MSTIKLNSPSHQPVRDEIYSQLRPAIAHWETAAAQTRKTKGRLQTPRLLNCPLRINRSPK